MLGNMTFFEHLLSIVGWNHWHRTHKHEEPAASDNEGDDTVVICRKPENHPSLN